MPTDPFGSLMFATLIYERPNQQILNKVGYKRKSYGRICKMSSALGSFISAP